MDNINNNVQGLQYGVVFFRQGFMKSMHYLWSTFVFMCFFGGMRKNFGVSGDSFSRQIMDHDSLSVHPLLKIDNQYILPEHLVVSMSIGNIFVLSKLMDMFWESAVGGDIEKLKILLHVGIPLNLTDSQGCSVLMLASQAKQEPMVAFLIAQQMQLDAVNNRGDTALMKAVEGGSDAIVQALLSAGAWPFLENKDGFSAAVLAEKNMHIQILSMVRRKSTQLWQSFHTAIGHNDKRHVVSYLNKNGPIHTLDAAGRTALMLASLYNRREILGLLLHKPQNVNKRDYAGFTALMIAVVHRHEACVRELLHNKEVDRNIRDAHGATILIMTVADCSNLEMAKLLVTAGASVNAYDDQGATALLRAVQCGCMDTVAYLMQEHAEVYYPYSIGGMALR